ncbi:type II toxin-antitoxin system VapC family toxin [Rhizobium lentis]|uniref:type II toxin-antitoxin system VapC family toxin n=1 Tax=Rhizobium lentis TaxID=1138194 RepID=UPI001C831B2C|nr:type II toxin-antitoxin system VapC family toxin [Rhizobium lentis]MBX5145180.1 type II toxin-antitoxin system VapC family toxin [Rhizobium lentis]
MIAIDTNLVVRYLTGDHPEQSARAREIIDGQAIFVAVTVVLEAEWVLRSVYGYSSSDVAQALRAFGGLSTVTIEDSATIAVAFDLVAKGMDFADALHLTKGAHCAAFVSFDRKFLKAAQAAGFETVRQA